MVCELHLNEKLSPQMPIGMQYTLCILGRSNKKVLTDHIQEQMRRWPGRVESQALLLNCLFMEDT